MLSDLCLILKTIGKIIAGLALLAYRPVFWIVRILLFLELLLAARQAVLNFQMHMLIGLGMIAVGLLFVVWTHELVKKTPVSMHKLITSGTFAVVRHPMYSGWCLIAIGAAVISGFWLTSVIAVWQTIFMLSVSCAEDEENAAIFGEAYKEYSRKVYLSGILIGCLRCLLSMVCSFRKKERSL